MNAFTPLLNHNNKPNYEYPSLDNTIKVWELKLGGK